jgi:predicted protein tyrosine phosphatase
MINIAIYSKLEFISYINSLNINDETVEQINEYFISVLPTGGPKGVRIFQQDHHNVITLVFDDVLQDELKDKYPDGKGYFTARAFTVEQSRVLNSFIQSIDINKKINIHCVEGRSRSTAIARFILEKKTHVNHTVYNLLKENNDNQ